jgi:hypothetical protein
VCVCVCVRVWQKSAVIDIANTDGYKREPE